MDTALAAEGTKAVISLLKFLCKATPDCVVEPDAFLVANFLHDICEVLENASFPIRKFFEHSGPNPLEQAVTS